MTPGPRTVQAWRVAIVGVVLGAWLLVTWLSPGIRDVFGGPVEVLRQLAAWLGGGEIFYHVGLTAAEALVGFAVGAVVGIAAGFTLTFVPLLRRLFDPLLGVLAVVPRIVLAPIFMVWFGLGIASKAALVTLIVFFIVYFNVEAGLRNVQAVLIDRARIMGAGRLGLLTEVYLPTSLVWLLSSLKVSVGFAFLGAIVAEYLGANAGVGSLIAVAQSQNDPNAVMAGLAVILAVVAPLDYLLGRVERRASAWRA